ncbi:NADPH-dependent ferric siderophore reductase, contains FAD-binding and SIP domains [Streptomyces sp. 1222.5]|uniref:siderophore-interacting protein n=1 Tax=unclassified Streptomyces TaxID=2593676 RepID=UPI00089866D3|nr:MULTISPECIES: siderophore-interacting protein [unclassified Streptomyces]PKW06717.1 NADPH-dependent ferric siderophore reductase [Streptomyces sp. 5112.2]SEC63536.1 NADPH-dependent ferric siderophore reductase, contains FAD-binding and SIP domains [Streptomyces sp. 2231.1]SED06613.1 NADPH-dependent ferric siderophore reductase, contains FAD-binding and SIP domains [Streptomyces sp. 1222.5]
MAERPGRKPRRAHTAQVVRTERLTPHMQRVVLGGEGLAGFAADTCTDHYVKLLFGPPGVTYPEPFDLERIRAEFPREQWPVTRTYTVRAFDPEHRELTLDFVIHGDEGLAGPWATRVRPGDPVRFMGPGGAYAPAPDADWHLLAGDESALPAIARTLETLPAGARAHAFVEVSGPEEEQKIDSEVEVVWLHRGTRPVGEALLEAVRALDFPAGRPHAFVHGEAGFVKELRRLLRVDLGIPREDLSISGYWRLGHNEDGWQASKRDWNARIEAEQEGGAAAA